MKYYTYYSYEPWGRGYIGSKPSGCEGDPLLDGYFGSYSDISFKPTEKIILGVYDTPEECLVAEVALHEFFEVDTNPHFANRAKQTSSKFYFDPSGSIRSAETRQKIGLSRLGEKHHLYGQIRHWITNGNEERFVNQEDPIPEGWRQGRSFSPVHTDLQRSRTSEVNSSRERSEAERTKISNTKKNSFWVNNGSHELVLQPKEEIPPGWQRGRLKSQCPHCNTVGSVSLLKRWHFEHCKLLKEK